jgi:hypothetical protein
LIEVRVQRRAAGACSDLPDNDPDLLNVHQLRLGSWVVFQQDQANSLRCKLAAIIEPANRIFVSRTG